jgi:RNA-directed DNA polymerase
MNKKPLHVLFDAMYHNKYDFRDFTNGDIATNYEILKHKNRTIYKTNKKLKTYHTFINLFLLEYLRTKNDVVFSYRKGVNVYDAVSKHASSNYFFKTDIAGFFTSIDRDLIKSTLEKSLDLAPIADFDQYKERILDLVTVKNILPIGFATSPLLSNACLYDFDNELASYCEKSDLIYTRYSDDIIVSANSRAELTDIKLNIDNLLGKYFRGKLLINETKSKFIRVGNKVKLLGMVILPNNKVTVDIKYKKDIEVMLHFYINDKEKFLDKVNGNIADGTEKISGYLNYVNTVDSSYLDKLRKKYGATIVDTFLHQSKKR